MKITQISIYRFAFALRFVFITLFVLSISMNAYCMNPKVDKAVWDELNRIENLSDRDNKAALVAVRKLVAEKRNKVNYETYSVILKTIFVISLDAGLFREAEASNKELLELAKANKDIDNIVLSSLSEVYGLIEKGDTARALVRMNELIAEYGDRQDPEVILNLKIASSYVQFNVGNIEEAINFQNEALNWTDKLPARQKESRLYRLNELAQLYLHVRSPQLTLELVEEGLKLASRVNVPKPVASLLITKGVALVILGKLDEGFKAFVDATNLAAEVGSPNLQLNVASRIADFYLQTRNFAKAEVLARENMKKATQIDDKYLYHVSLANLGFALTFQNKFDEGLENISKAITYYRDINMMHEFETLLREATYAYMAAGRLKEALDLSIERQELMEKLFTEKRAKAVATVQEIYNVEQQKKQIAELANENKVKDILLKNQRLQQWVIGLAASVILLVGLGIYFLYRKVKKTNLELLQVNEQLEFHAIRDPLTGLYNRRSFVELMHKRPAPVNEDRREEGSNNPDCLILMDVDHFKHINDHFGHAIGDAVLMEVAHRLRKIVRDSDMVLRWGGEEFLIYSPRANFAQVPFLVERILRTIGHDFVQVNNINIPVTMSAGFISLPFANVPESICNWEKALQIADKALYLAKLNGRNNAIGVLNLKKDFASAFAEIDQSMHDAIKAGVIDVIEVQGPPRQAVASEQGANARNTNTLAPSVKAV